MLLILLLIAGIGAIVLGIKGFTPAGIPLTRTKNITGGTAKGVGVACFILGAAILGGTGLMFLMVALGK